MVVSIVVEESTAVTRKLPRWPVPNEPAAAFPLNFIVVLAKGERLKAHNYPLASVNSKCEGLRIQTGISLVHPIHAPLERWFDHSERCSVRC